MARSRSPLRPPHRLPEGAGTISELQPGISTGIPLGAPLPQGIFDVTIGNYGRSNPSPGNVDQLGAVAPAWLIWSTPWTIAGGRVLLDTVQPWVGATVKGGPYLSDFGNRLFDAQLKWDLGGGFFGGFQAGVYVPSAGVTPIGRDMTSFQGVAAVSYLKDGWDLSATMIYGNGGTDSNGVWYSDWLNLDLTATRKFGKWELGLVGYYSTDLNGTSKLSQFALGPLVGYDFGWVNAQFKFTRDVYEQNYGGYDNRAWLNLTFPLWVAQKDAPLK